MIRKLLLILFLISVGYPADAITPKEVPNVQVQRRDQWVSDPAGLLSPEALRHANASLDSLNRANTTEVAAVIVTDVSGYNADDFATELFELWGIGRKDRSNGLLLLISRDDRRAVIRTGSGMEIAMTDGRAGSIIRHDIAPAMKEGDIDRALMNAISSIGTVINDPAYYDDLHSDIEAKTSPGGKANNENFFLTYLIIGGVLNVAMIFFIVFTYIKTSKDDPVARYTRLDKLRLPVLMLVALSLGMGIVTFLLLWLILRHLRLRRHECPNCRTRMYRLDEVTDNEYLTPAQDIEEKLNSVDYDVWLCPNCNETDIIPYVNKRAAFTRCPVCGSRAETLEANRILRRPTQLSEGIGQREYRCHNCGNTRSVPYKIAKAVSPPIFIGGGGRGFSGGGFGSGIGGGGFGGGSTNGGGASGSW